MKSSITAEEKKHTPPMVRMGPNAILHFALPLYLLRETGSITLFGAVNACSFPG